MSYRDKFKERYANDPEFRAQHIARTISSQNKRREKYVEWKNGFSCSRCGDTRSYVIDFHHRDPAAKEGKVANLFICRRKSFIEELPNLVAICANCHRELHYLMDTDEEAYRAEVDSLPSPTYDGT